MKPITDKMRISREKLAFIIDSTAATVAGLALVSTWIGYEISLIKDGYCKNITLSENSSQNRITGVIANGASVNVNPSFNTARDVTIYNYKDVTLVFEYSSTVNSTLHRVNIPAGSTWQNTLKRDDYSDEGFYLTDNIIAQYGSTLANGEVNINWTT